MINEIIILLMVYGGTKLFLDLHQINYIRKSSISEKDMGVLNIDSNYIAKSNSYNIDKLKFSIVNTIISITIVCILLFFHGISFIASSAKAINFWIINSELTTILLFFTLMTLINIPLNYVKVFFLETKYGFNNSNLKLFITDTILSFFVSLLFIIILFSAFDYVYKSYETSWWYIMWILFIIFNFLILYLYPNFISPLFNKFEKLTDKKIVDNINNLSNRTNFNISDIYVMDGSKRSKHSNAYFTGMFKNKRIVFFDTLIDMLSVSEIESVLAHEIGHYKKKHITISMIANILFSFIIFYSLYKVSFYSPIFNLFSLNSSSSSEFIIMISLLLPIFLFFISPLFSVLSRKHEYEADNFAKEHTSSISMVSALIKLYKDNLTVINSSPFYSAIYNSHPTVFERINNIKS